MKKLCLLASASEVLFQKQGKSAIRAGAASETVTAKLTATGGDSVRMSVTQGERNCT